MATETFTKQDFERKALPVNKTTGEQMWESLGLQNGEEAYSVKIDKDTSILVRSSVKPNGVCAGTGEDSIRAWLTTSDGKPLGSKVSKFTTRTKGWDVRTKNVLRTLWSWRKNAGNCTCCGEPRQIFKVKKAGENIGRIFTNCRNECQGQFRFLTEKKPTKMAQATVTKSLKAESQALEIESQQH